MTKSILIPALAIVVFSCTQSRSTKHEQATDSLISESSEPAQQASSINIDSMDWHHQALVDDMGEVNRAFVLLESGDSTIFLHSDMQMDHRFFGYASPSLQAERLILFSIFTNDVENNPFECRLGAYYQTGGMQGYKLKYIGLEDDFVKAVAIGQDGTRTTLYFEKKWISLE
jgi:hypothetical protein